MYIFFSYYQTFMQRVIATIESRERWIPLSGVLLWYLRLPFPVKIGINAVGALLSIFLIYNIGFVVLQSRAKNEVLSFISAYTNPVEFPMQSVYHHAFIFFILLVGSIFPVAILYITIQFIRNFFVPFAQRQNHSVIQVRISIFIISLFSIVSTSILFHVLRELLPHIIYYLLYRTKAPGLYEQIRKYFGSGATYDSTDYVNLHTLTEELSIAFIEPTLWTAFFGFLAYMSVILLRRSTGWKKYTLYPLATILLSFIFLLFVFSHSATQWGALGKNLAQFDNDYVCVEYSGPNEGVRSVIGGLRISQGDNYVVVRTDNSLHTITTDKMHVQSLTIEEFRETACKFSQKNEPM